MHMLSIRIYLLYILRGMLIFFVIIMNSFNYLPAYSELGDLQLYVSCKLVSKILFYIESTINFGLIKIKA